MGKKINSRDMILGTGLSFGNDNDIATRIISTALDHEIVRFDTAPSYKTEGLLGTILKDQIKTGKTTRNKFYIQTKIDAWQMQEGRINLHIEDSLRKLNVDYLDALLIHWPVPEYMMTTWEQLRQIQREGKIQKIGICNVRLRQLKEYSSWNPEIIQIERHPLNTFQDEVEFCKKRGIEVQAYSPLCKMDDRIKNNEIIRNIAMKYGKDEGQIVLRWHLDTGVVPVFSTSKVGRIISYADLESFFLTEQEINAISQININYKLYLESIACPGF